MAYPKDIIVEVLYKEGKIKAIGVSNYQASQLYDLIHFNDTIPVVNQIKTTLRCQRKELFDMMHEQNVIMQGYQVFGKEECLPVYEDAHYLEIANKYNISTRQLVLKYFMQQGISMITRPMEKQWMKDNLYLFDFELTEEEMDYIASFDMKEYNTTPSFEYQRTKDMLSMKK